MNKRQLLTLKSDISQVVESHPELETHYSKGTPKYLEGYIDVKDLEDTVRGSFRIRISIPWNYPNGFPDLRELDKVIPRVPDRHIYESGDCCVTVTQWQILEAHKGIGIEQFVNKYALPFLANQIHFEEYGEWANGEYSHGHKGLIEFYEEFLGTTDSEILIGSIELAMRLKRLGRNKPCFCGSDLKYKTCHGDKVATLELLGYARLKTDLEIIQNQ